ncbi:ribbon-helix-helix protein, CopG family [Clostridium perfringens]|uniref:ribbon-helix-helix protein, CopG family n=1 Tax=Clostridium perfringens TaxID=1502 RepID=UPI002862CDE8|nr:ribbon-helix-helix protein, CopG family [Clostridium perfringens]
MAREKSVKVRLTDKEDAFINQEVQRLGVNRSEVVRRLIQREMEKKELNIDK